MAPILHISSQRVLAVLGLGDLDIRDDFVIAYFDRRFVRIE